MEEVLRVEDLRTYFFTDEGVASAVDGVSLSAAKGATLGLVGESGCGKSITALSIMRLVPPPQGRIVDGRIVVAGRELKSLSDVEMRDIRGKLASMIFQEPMTSLNPVFTIGSQVMEAVRVHTGMGRREAREIAVEYLAKVGIPGAHQRMSQYPHQLSGGMKQRVMIAMALCLRPALLIADEPTTALDVTIQAGILKLIKEMQQETGAAVLLITHDLGVIAEVGRRSGCHVRGQDRRVCLLRVSILLFPPSLHGGAFQEPAGPDRAGREAIHHSGRGALRPCVPHGMQVSHPLPPGHPEMHRRRAAPGRGRTGPPGRLLGPGGGRVAYGYA